MFRHVYFMSPLEVGGVNTQTWHLWLAVILPKASMIRSHILDCQLSDWILSNQNIHTIEQHCVSVKNVQENLHKLHIWIIDKLHSMKLGPDEYSQLTLNSTIRLLSHIFSIYNRKQNINKQFKFEPKHLKQPIKNKFIEILIDFGCFFPCNFSSLNIVMTLAYQRWKNVFWHYICVEA